MSSDNSLLISREKKPEKVSAELEKKDSNSTTTSPPSGNEEVAVVRKSFGVRRAEILLAQYQSIPLKVILFASVFFVCYCYSIDGTTRNNLMLYATSSYRNHSGFTTINVLTSVIGGISQPVYARLSDRFGRVELLILSIILYVVGTLIQSQAYGFNRFAAGSVIYQLGTNGVRDMVWFVLADSTNMNWRLVISFIPATPHLINTWAGGDVMASVRAKYSWQWGIGMYAFIFPLSCVPLLACLTHMTIRARKLEEWKQLNREISQEFKKSNIGKLLVSLFWEVDLVGMILIMVSLCCILIPFTIAGGVRAQWQRAAIIVPLVIGVLLIPGTMLWEARFAKSPILPLPLLRDRGVWAGICIAMLVYWVRDMPGEALYTVLVVGLNQSTKAATRISRLFVFVGTLTGIGVGIVVAKVRKLKPFIVFGSFIWFGAMGILVHFRGSGDGYNYKWATDGIIGGLCLLGFGSGFINFPTRVAIQTVTNHEYMAVMISFYLASYSIGSAIGSAVVGAIWTQRMYGVILDRMNQLNVSNAEELAQYVYESPFEFIEEPENAWGEPSRVAVALAYSYIQRILCIVGLCLVVLVLICALSLRDHKLESVQSLEDGDVHDVNGKKVDVMVNRYDDDVIINYIKRVFGKKNEKKEEKKAQEEIAPQTN
ncbi:Siderophore iron transporter ARN1 [Candida viswanathii]|uniref:Siderophore iron transporter ARN1 n=1 Tax=Candida viswanathii TaxID=5486 RepID=A0A367XZI7_9ASCO|nr:Siderophore iron transporter ARN1 [Candida viswanathii]